MVSQLNLLTSFMDMPLDGEDYTETIEIHSLKAHLHPAVFI